MKYRLALKLGAGEEHGKAYLAHSVFRLKESAMSSGFGKIPAGVLSDVDQLIIIKYENSLDSLQPMTNEQFDEQIKLLRNAVGSSCVIHFVNFDKELYQAWLEGRTDTQQTRAEWANQIDLREHYENDIPSVNAN